MSWARNIQSRIQQQQQLQKPGSLAPSGSGGETPQKQPSSPTLSALSSPITSLTNALRGSGGISQPPTTNITTSTTTTTNNTSTSPPSPTISTQVKVGQTSFTTSASLQAAASGNNLQASIQTTNVTVTSPSMASPIGASTGIPNPNAKPSSLPSPSQSPMQTRNTSAPTTNNNTTTNTTTTSTTTTPTTSTTTTPTTSSSNLGQVQQQQQLQQTQPQQQQQPTPIKQTTPYIFPNKIQPKSLTTDMFRGSDFSHVSFVEDLTRKLVNDQMGADGLHFEPAPFNQLFLNTQLQLSQLESNIDRRLDDLAEECNDFSYDYKRKLQDLAGSYQECFQHFKKLEKGVNTIGTKAVHFGDELDSVNQQKVKAQGALSLINYLLELNSVGASSEENGGITKRSDIFTNSDRIHELAHLVKKLSSVSEDIKEISGFKQGKLETESISNSLENDLLNQFERAAERNDYDKMKQCATTLHGFNGGERCRSRYIQKLKMFFDIDSFRKDENLANNITKRLIRGNNIVDTRFEIFYTDILKDVSHEQMVIQNVFVNQTSAMAMLIVRLFEQRVRLFIENVLSLESNNVSMFLQTVHYAFNSTKKLLVDPLQSYGIVGVDLNQLLNSIFYQYQEGYIQKETTYLVSLFQSNVVEECERLQTLDKYSMYFEDGLNPEITQMFVQQTENALTRSYTLSLDNVLADNIKTIFFLMLEYLFEKYSMFVLNKYIELPIIPSSNVDTKSIQDAISQLFRVVLSVNQIVGQIQSMFQVFVLPHIQTSMIVQSQCSDQLYFNISSLENCINTGLENSLTTMIQLIEKTLIPQGRNDYLIDDYDNSVTDTCASVIKLIQSFYDMAKINLQGKNFHIYVEELGLKSQFVFINHFKKFKIGQGIGTLKLMRDLTEYRNLSKQFKSQKVDDAFELLFEISKLHLVNPENFKLVIEGGALTRMSKQDLIIFIKQRSDFKSIWLDTL
ncbi:hypothetical protein ACTFIU_011525 [Dictyostelium citrinum]